MQLYVIPRFTYGSETMTEDKIKETIKRLIRYVIPKGKQGNVDSQVIHDPDPRYIESVNPSTTVKTYYFKKNDKSNVHSVKVEINKDDPSSLIRLRIVDKKENYYIFKGTQEDLIKIVGKHWHDVLLSDLYLSHKKP